MLQNVILNGIHFNTFEGVLVPGALNYWMYFFCLQLDCWPNIVGVVVCAFACG